MILPFMQRIQMWMLPRGGVNDLLAEALGLQNTEVLAPTYAEEMKKVVVFVPVTHAEEVRKH